MIAYKHQKDMHSKSYTTVSNDSCSILFAYICIPVQQANFTYCTCMNACMVPTIICNKIRFQRICLCGYASVVNSICELHSPYYYDHIEFKIFNPQMCGHIPFVINNPKKLNYIKVRVDEFQIWVLVLGAK
jgi:hypothetical protein